MKDLRYVTESAPFKDMVKKRWLISIGMTLLIIAIYFGFILTIAFKKELLASKWGGKLTVGIPVGLGIIVFAWLLTGAYTWWANNYYDNWVKSIKEKFYKGVK